MPTNVGFPPFGYVAPSWPSLYWPFSIPPADEEPNQYLFNRDDIVWFTLAWTLILSSVLYGLAAIWGYFVFFRRKKAILFLLSYGAFGLLAGAIAGGVVGGLLSAFYIAGFLPMQTWIPLAWAIIVVLFTIIASYPEVTLTTL